MDDKDFQTVLERVERNKSRATAQVYLGKVRDFRAWLSKDFEEADAIDVEDWLAKLDEEYANASTVGQGRAALVAAYEELNKLIEAGRIEGHGWVGDTPPEKASYTPEDTDSAKARESREDLVYLKPSQVDELAKAAGRLRDELIIRLLFQTGLRVSELCEIRMDDLDRAQRSINVRGKGRKNRTVYYQPSLDILVDTWIQERRPAIYHAEDSDYLFPTSHSENITRVTVAEFIREAAEDAGHQDVYTTDKDGVERHSITPHVLRHSFAMEAISSDGGDWDVYTLSQALGHSSAEITTSTYLHDDEEEVRRAYMERGPSTA